MEERLIDLTVLGSVSGGDRDFEREVIGLFIEQSLGNIETLHKNCVDGESLPWREAAHQLKGGASNIGAEPLRVLCREAQDMLVSTQAHRQEMAARISCAFDAVVDCLKAEGLAS